MELADKLAHLVRRGIQSGLGRGAASARARVRQYAPRLEPWARKRASVIGVVSFCLVMLAAGFAVAVGGGSAVRAADSTAAHSRDHRTRADAKLADDPGNAALDQLGATASLALAP